MNSALADELTDYDATALAQAIRQKKLSSLEVVEAHFERIDRLNAKYNALVTLDREGAQRRARQADADLAIGKSWGPLHGVPITIKDALQTAGLRTTVGYRKYADFVPEQDAWVVDRLKQAGAIVLGKTNCSKLCGDVQTRNELFGATNNPWDVQRTSGGSSGGEAVAVALGMSALGIGSDTAGSLRGPAGYCGVFCLKPSLGKIRRDGLMPSNDPSHPRQDSLTVVGPLARSVRDLALCYEVLTDERVPLHEPAAPKIYWTQEFLRPALDDEIATVLNGKFDMLNECGANVKKVAAPFDFRKFSMKYLRLMMYEFTPAESDRMLAAMFWMFESVRALAFAEVGRAYAKLKQEQAAMARLVEEFMQGCDCWVLPVTSSVAFPHLPKPRPIQITVNGRDIKRGYYPNSIGFTCTFNMLGNPSVVIPVARNRNNLPIALQVVGKPGEDRKLLQIAQYLADKLGAMDPVQTVTERSAA